MSKKEDIDPRDNFKDNPFLQDILESSVQYVLNVSKHPKTFKRDVHAIIYTAMTWAQDDGAGKLPK